MCHLIQRFCEWIDYLMESGKCNPYMRFLNGFMKKLGCTLVYVVYVITIFLSFTAFALILPYEQLYKSAYLLGVLCMFGAYLLINVVYHYEKARRLKPVPKPGIEGDRFCKICNYWKSDRTHHCGVCECCVLGMDHHCIWINQCVGSHNHRHFFLFISFLTLSALTIVLAGYNSAYDAFFDPKLLCSSVLVMAPLQEWICSFHELGPHAIIFCYLLSILLLLLVGGLTTWNCYLISKGLTYIDYLQHSDNVRFNPHFQNPLNRGFKSNWKNFLGLRGRRTFFWNVVLPSSHPPVLYDSYGRVEKFEVV